MKKLILFIIVIFYIQISISQTIYRGREYKIDDYGDYFIPLTYTREYREDSNIYVTTYHVSSINNGYYLDITATHYKKQRRLVVEVKDITTPYNQLIHKEDRGIEDNIYAEKIPIAFGIKGSFKEAFDIQDRLPNDLLVKFVSNKYENIKIMQITGRSQYKVGEKWYLLDK